MQYYLTDVFGNKLLNAPKSILAILNTYRYYSSKDFIVSENHKEKYLICIDRPNKTITLKSVNSSKAIEYKKNTDGKYEIVED